MKNINIVLHEPEIPQNTGNIARTCAATGTALHIIKPMGFAVDDRKLKRAGLDYWHSLDITYYESLDDFRKIRGLISTVFPPRLLAVTRKCRTVTPFSFSSARKLRDFPRIFSSKITTDACAFP